jgi:amino acid transporter
MTRSRAAMIAGWFCCGIALISLTGFGNFAGFNAAFGYWASNVAGNVFFLVFTMTTLGTFFPGLGEGNTRSWLLGWPRRACGYSIT